MEFPPQTPGYKTGQLQTKRLDASRPEDIARAAAILRAGGLVAFPTETVYGLGANALSPEAVEKIFVAKERPHWDPLIVHIADKEMLARVWNNSVILSGASPPYRDAESKNPDAVRPTLATGLFSTDIRPVESLIEKFWPGPLTLLLPKTSAIPNAVTANRPLVGVRMPAHPVALELIRQAGVPIAAPSANVFGHTSPTTAAHVLADLDGRIDAVLDGGPTSIGLESTVIGIRPREHLKDAVIIYRDGAITEEMLYVPGVGAVDRYVALPGTARSPESLPSPGVGIRHYAPRARLILVDGLRDEEVIRSGRPLEMIEDSLVEAIDRAYDGTEILGVMLPDRWNLSCAQLTYPWGDWRDGKTLARRLFAGFRSLDDLGATVILCPLPAMPGIGEAIRDRLRKAARP